MVFDVLEKGLRASSYQNRAKILFNQFPSELETCGSFTVNCSTGLPTLVRRLLQSVPSFTELVVYDNGCDPQISIRTLPIIDKAALCVEKIIIVEVLKLPRVCHLPECTGSVSANLSAIGTIVIFKVFSESGNIKLKLQDLAKEFTNPLGTRGTHKLIGMIHENVPKTRHSFEKDLSHYTGFCLRTGCTWKEHDDNRKKKLEKRIERQ